jgi:glutathione peroxidase
MTAIQEIPLETITGDPTTLGHYYGQVLLVVNVASKCGLTPQYEALERLHEEHRDEGFSVLGFPANDFAGQEPGTNREIAEFCQVSFGVQFPMFAKLVATGPDRHPLFHALTTAMPDAEGDKAAFRAGLRRHGIPATDDPEVVWNFEKFLVSRDGRVVGRFAPDLTPDDPRLVDAVRRELGAPVPPQRVTVTRRISAPAAAVFAVVCDPARHVDIDGSGMLVLAHPTPPLTAVGDTFVMDMDREPLGDLPMGRYQSQNTVTRLEPDRLLEWAPGGVGRNPYGHVYGYALTPAGDDATEVSSYCDWSGLPERRRSRGMHFPVVPASMLERSLDNLEQLLTSRPA